jgi:uncharacterized coiled-coil DUF342 family protein
MAKNVIKKLGGTKNNDYKELVDFLVVKFDEVNDKLDRKADKDQVKTMIDGVNNRIDGVNDRITRLSDKLDDYHAEQTGLKRQVDKHEKWHFQTAAKVGIDLLAE